MSGRKRDDRGKEREMEQRGMERKKEREIDENLREKEKKRLRSFGT